MHSCVRRDRLLLPVMRYAAPGASPKTGRSAGRAPGADGAIACAQNRRGPNGSATASVAIRREVPSATAFRAARPSPLLREPGRPVPRQPGERPVASRLPEVQLVPSTHQPFAAEVATAWLCHARPRRSD